MSSSTNGESLNKPVAGIPGILPLDRCSRTFAISAIVVLQVPSPWRLNSSNVAPPPGSGGGKVFEKAQLVNISLMTMQIVLDISIVFMGLQRLSHSK